VGFLMHLFIFVGVVTKHSGKEKEKSKPKMDLHRRPKGQPRSNRLGDGGRMGRGRRGFETDGDMSHRTRDRGLADRVSRGYGGSSGGYHDPHSAAAAQEKPTVTPFNHQQAQELLQELWALYSQGAAVVKLKETRCQSRAVQDVLTQLAQQV